jgi:hypothetical protein
MIFALAAAFTLAVLHGKLWSKAQREKAAKEADEKLGRERSDNG